VFRNETGKRSETKGYGEKCMERAKTERPLTDDPSIAALARSTIEGSARILATSPSAGSLALARKAVRHFLLHEFRAREIRIIKIARSPDDAAGWNAEAEMLVPNLGIKTLGLPLKRDVLEKQFCAVELDSNMAVISYEFVDPQDR
jgi:hypothetical protein